jgi:hypothetical protein
VYSMYPWDGTGAAAEADAPARSASIAAGGEPVPPPAHELRSALQFALDRRDNGGDAGRRRQ